MTLFQRIVSNTVLVNMLALIIVVMGLVSFQRLPRQALPDIDLNWVYVMVPYPGASPAEIERKVLREVEGAVEDIEDVKTVTSIAYDGLGQVSIRFEFMPESEFRLRFQDIRRAVDGIRDELPGGVEDIAYLSLDTSSFDPLVHLSLSGDYPEARLNAWSHDLRQQIRDLPGVYDVTSLGFRDRCLYVDADPTLLEAAELPLSALVDAIQAQNFDLPAGTYTIGDTRLSVKTVGALAGSEALEDVIVRPSSTGGHLRIRDLATVRDGFTREIMRSRQDAAPAYAMAVTKKAGTSALEVFDDIRELTLRFEERLPEDVEVRITGDTTVNIRAVLLTLYKNAVFGLILVVLILFLFLNLSNAIFAVVGIVVSFMGTFMALDLLGETLNSNSLFGLVLVLGMIVDDAIVILENIYRHVQRGLAPARAAVQGVSEVAVPVISSSLTTMAGFLPLMLLPGIMGEFLRVVPLTVAVALAVSLFEALFVLPSHVSDLGREHREVEKSPAGSRLLDRIRPAYVRVLERSFDHRYLLGSFALLLPIGAVAVISYKVADADLFAGEEEGQFFVQAWGPEGSSLGAMDERVRELETIVLDRVPVEERDGVLATAGLVRTSTDWIWDSAVGEVFVSLVPRRERERSTAEIIASIRDEILDVPGLASVKIWEKVQGPPTGAAVDFKIKGPYLEDLKVLSDRLCEELSALPGVVDVDSDMKLGEEQIDIRLRPDVAGLVSLDNYGLASFVRTALDGDVATTILEGDEKIDVVVRVKEDARRELADLLNLRVPSRSGGFVPLGDIADVEVTSGLSAVHRFGGHRAVTVTADLVEGASMSSGDVVRWVEGRFDEIGFPGYDVDFGGEFKEFQDALSGIGRLGLLGVLLIYLILGAQFRSFMQPFIILYTIPIGLAGAAVSLVISGNPLTITTIYGFVALAGVVVNDSLVLVEFINLARERGLSTRAAILSAGGVRLRPIVLTTVTTVAGLLPMMLGIGGSSPVWAPLATTIVWGLVLATALTLLVIPALYGVLDDLSARLRIGRFHGHRNDGPGHAVDELILDPGA